MKKKFWVLLLALALLLTGCGEKGDDPQPPKQDVTTGPAEEVFVKEPKDAEEVKFVEHVDGDTSKFKVDGKVETVRYLLIDTPETRHVRP
ncbi:thermonuclease family protein [Melghirimyces profundicolus]|uniref:thermonuclease family protein n=1 Tax=Melghirimyces profundicolus TaxID=1242148 RepID=UPI002481B601|nr:lipoprotein [Melghirimyces profundicolus]